MGEARKRSPVDSYSHLKKIPGSVQDLEIGVDIFTEQFPGLFVAFPILP
jgi:hypothetical protein